MLKEFLREDEHLKDNPLLLHLRTFATSLIEDGYADETIQSKLSLLADFGQQLGRTELAVTNLDERRVQAFLKHKQRTRRGDPKTLKQFLDHLQKCGVVPERKLILDRSPLADILSRHEHYLRSERGLATATIRNYQSFVHKSLVERFRQGPFLFREVKPSDISAFILRCGHSIGVRRAQMMTTAFRSFFRPTQYSRATTSRKSASNYMATQICT